MIEIDLPDGSVAEFPDGTPDDVIKKALQKAFPAPMSTGEDVVRSGASGARWGLESIPGMFGDVGQLGENIGSWLSSKMGASPEQIEKAKKLRDESFGLLPDLPTTQEIHDTTSKVVGESHKPQTTAGEYAFTTGNFIGGALGPGGVVRKTANVALPALASETAGQVTRIADGGAYKEYEPYARFAGGLAGGVMAAGNPRRQATAQAARGAPTEEVLRNETNALYDQLRNSGIQYDQAAYIRLVRDAASDIRLGSRSLSPQTVATINEMADWARRGTVPDFNDINDLSIMIGAAADDAASAMARGDRAAGAEVNALHRLRDRLENFETNAPMTNTAGMSQAEVNALRGQARQTALRNIKNRRLQRVLTDADTYAGGREAGIRQGLRTMLKSNRGRVFQGAEREALLEVANGRKGWQTLSRFGFDMRNVSGNATFLPTIAAGAAGFGAGLPYAAGLAGAGTAAKFISPALTERAFEQAAGAVRGGGLHGPQAAQTLEALERARRARLAITTATAGLPMLNSPFQNP